MPTYKKWTEEERRENIRRKNANFVARNASKLTPEEIQQRERQKEAKAKADAGEWVTKQGKKIVVVEPKIEVTRATLIDMDDSEVLEPFKRMERVNWADE